MTETTPADLISAAREAATRAHAPYSRFAVGAALLMTDGSLVTGANVENASYGLSLCAETVAIATASAAGRLREVVAVGVIGGAMDADDRHDEARDEPETGRGGVIRVAVRRDRLAALDRARHRSALLDRVSTAGRRPPVATPAPMQHPAVRPPEHVHAGSVERHQLPHRIQQAIETDVYVA